MLFRTRQICLKKRKIKQRLQIPKEKKSRPTWPKTTSLAKGKKGMVFLDQRLALVNEWILKTSRCLIGKSHFDARSPQRPWQSWQTCFRRCDCGACSNIFQMFVTSVVFTFQNCSQCGLKGGRREHGWGRVGQSQSKVNLTSIGVNRLPNINIVIKIVHS